MLEHMVQADLVDTALGVCKCEEIRVTVRNAFELHRVLADREVDIDVPVKVALTTAEM